MATIQLTWLGHSAFRFDTPDGKRVYLDPFLENPRCPEGEKDPERCDILALTHGHGDHLGSSVEIGRKHAPKVVAIFEMANWFAWQGVPDAIDFGMNKGGTVDVDGVKFTMTQAQHSGGFIGDDSITYLGEPAGYVVEVENCPKLYFSGDTCVFGDMKLIGDLYGPDVAILPIGDHFTMGPKEAALALELLGVKRCVPCHYGTFPILHGTPDQLSGLAPGVEVLSPEPGETIEL